MSGSNTGGNLPVGPNTPNWSPRDGGRPHPDLPQCDKYVLSQEVACDWISCLLKSGIDWFDDSDICSESPQLNCKAVADVAQDNGIYDYALPTCKGGRLSALSQIRCEDEIWLIVDPCTKCGRLVSHYIKLLEAILNQNGDPKKLKLKKNRLGACFCGA